MKVRYVHKCISISISSLFYGFDPWVSIFKRYQFQLLDLHGLYCVNILSRTVSKYFYSILNPGVYERMIYLSCQFMCDPTFYFIENTKIHKQCQTQILKLFGFFDSHITCNNFIQLFQYWFLYHMEYYEVGFVAGYCQFISYTP